MPGPDESGEGHLAAEVVAAYLVERTLDASERSEVERHLVECSACRREAVEVGPQNKGGCPLDKDGLRPVPG